MGTTHLSRQAPVSISNPGRLPASALVPKGVLMPKRVSMSAKTFIVSTVIVLTILCGLSTMAQARALKFKDTSQFSYRLKEKPLQEFLLTLLTEQGHQGVVSEQVAAMNRRLNGIRQGTPQSIFDSILRTNGLVTYFDGSKVYIYQVNELIQRFIAVPADDFRQLKKAIKAMNMHDRENVTRFNRSTGLVSINGTPAYVNQIQRIIQALNIRNLNAASEFQYYSLKFAWATDRVFTVGGREVTIPGVASILRQAIGEQPTRMTSQPGDSALSVRSESLKGSGMAAIGRQAGDQKRQITLGDDKTINVFSSRGNNDFAPSESGLNSQRLLENDSSRVVADPHHNGIIIRDLPERMPLYAKLIKKLDRPTPIVEIEATIIDINIDKLSEQGIEWRFGQNNLEVLFAHANSKTNQVGAALAGSVNVLEQIPGFQLGAIIGNHNQLVSRLNLLEKEGLVSITSRPRVATLNDLDAVIESGRSLYVPVEGAFETDLFKVYSGTVLRVTPHIIKDGPETRIRLLVSVEDGTVDMLTDTDGASVPASTRNAVVTQAIVNSGHSLLLGGLVREASVQETSKIPLLGDLPLLGKLFRTDKEKGNRSERMYIISPRIITSQSADQTARGIMNKTEALPLASRPSTSGHSTPAEKNREVAPQCKNDCQPGLTADKLVMF